jgi:polysaccharide biosynthesis protein PslH
VEDRRVLLISEAGCPPPYLGNRVRTRDLIRNLRGMGYEVHFASVCMSEMERASTKEDVDHWLWDFLPYNRPASSLNRIRRGILRQATSIRNQLRPNRNQLFRSEWLTEAINIQKRMKYKRVIVSYACYSRFLLAFQDALKLIDTHDVFSNRKEQLSELGIDYYFFSYSPIGEAEALRRADRIIAIHNDDAAYFRTLPGIGAVYTVGLNVEPPATAELPRTGVIGYIGSANEINIKSIRLFLSNTWPKVSSGLANVRFLIAGGVSNHIPDIDGVNKLGFVKDLHSFYKQVDLVLNPMIVGTGLKIKTLEPLGFGRCCITSKAGAQGLDKLLGNGIYTCNSEDEFIFKIKYLLKNPDVLEEAISAARDILAEMRATNLRNLAAALDCRGM